jgi:hypothetical protein
MRTAVRWALMVASTAVGGALGDELFHHRRGVLEYPDGRQPPWVLGLFAASGVGAVLMYRLVARFLPENPTPPDADTLLHDAAWAFASWLLSGLLVRHGLVDLLVLVGLFAARVPWRRAPASLANAAALAILGPIVEAVLVRLHLFDYAAGVRVELVGIPYWLPALYLHMAFAGETVSRLIGHEGTGPVRANLSERAA